MDDHASRILKGSISVFLATVAIIVVRIFFNPILVRLVGKASYGIYATLLAVFSIATPMVGMGLFNSIRKHMGEHLEDKESVAGAGYGLAFLFLLVTLIIGLSIVGFLNLLHYLPGPMYISLLAIVFALSLFTLHNSLRSILYGLHKEERSEALRLIQKVSASVLGLLLVYMGLGVPGIFVGIFLSLLFITVVGLWLVRRDISFGFHMIRKGVHRYGKELFSFGGLTLISMLLAQALYQSDVLLAGYFLSSSKVGAYKAALVLAEMLWLIPMAFQRVLLHHVSDMWSSGRSSKMIKIGARIAKYVTLGMILVGFGLFVLADPFVTLYFGPDFGNSVLPLQMLIIGSLGFGLARVLNPIIEGTGYIKEGIKISSVIVALNIGLNIILIPIYGIIGAAIATSISYFAKLVQYNFLLKKVNIPLMSSFPTKRMIALAVLFLALLRLSLFLPIPEQFTLVAIPIIGLGLFLALSRGLKLWSVKEIKDMRALLS